jgi:hypothetical protein
MRRPRSPVAHCRWMVAGQRNEFTATPSKLSDLKRAFEVSHVHYRFRPRSAQFDEDQSFNALHAVSDGWLRLREFSQLSTGGGLEWLLPLDWLWSSGSLKAITIRPTAST